VIGTVAASNVEPTIAAVTDGATPTRSGWLVGPWFDALFIANILWPIVLMLQFTDGFGGQPGVQFWQVYFVTTPHRWITLALVFLDRERFQERRGAFLAVAAAIAVVCLGVRWTTGALTCLVAIDYVWNAWHFASQHHGIYRLYTRLSDPGRHTGLFLEKWSMRLFLLYVTLRIVTASWSDATWNEWLRGCDWAALLAPIGLVAHDLVRARFELSGRIVYLASVCVLYTCLLWAVHERRPGLVLALATTSALFHALEYLALVSWSVDRRHAVRGDQLGMLGRLAPRWGAALGVFVLVLGAGGWLMDQRFFETWLFINVIVAFLHYAYDGLIWRRAA
jgi:hypothetical protein